MRQKILIIDDDEQDRKLIEKRLSRVGFTEIFTSRTGEEGVRAAGEINPDIVITDTVLPGIDGHETCRQIKQIKGLKAKVIVMTGLIDAVDSDKARRSGADDYVVKSSSVKEIIAVVRETAGRLSDAALQE